MRTGGGIPTISWRSVCLTRARMRHPRLVEGAFLASIEERIVEDGSGLRAEDGRDNRAPEPVQRG
ncbi:hypothetical protein B0H19DRAFT_1108862, partial [Mycena capillaripes]